MNKERECCDIKVIEKDDGFKIEITGEDAKKCLEYCTANCCTTKDEK
jgi:hypothetical protein